MKLCWLVERNSEQIASVRLRVLRISETLAAHKVNTVVTTPAEFVHERDAADIYVFSKAYSPPALLLAAKLRRAGARIVFDLCDNRFIYGDDNLLKMIKYAHRITCPTESLAAVIAEHHPDVQVIPDYMEPARRTDGSPSLRLRIDRFRCRRAAGTRLRLVWFGNAGSPGVSTGMDELAREVPALNRLHLELPFHLMVISNSYTTYLSRLRGARFPSTYCRWRLAEFSDLLDFADLAIIPSADSEYNHTKSENRLLTCIAHQLPACASPVPSYRKFAEWVPLGDISSGIRQFAARPDEFRNAMQRAYAYASGQFSLETISGQWMSLFEDLSGAH